LREDHAKTTPILRYAQEQALRVKPMLDRRLRRQDLKRNLTNLPKKKKSSRTNELAQEKKDY